MGLGEDEPVPVGVDRFLDVHDPEIEGGHHVGAGEGGAHVGAFGQVGDVDDLPADLFEQLFHCVPIVVR